MEKKLYIRLEVIEGEREHTHHCLHEVDADIETDQAATEYAKYFWDDEEDSEPDEHGYFMQQGGEIAVRYTSVRELTQQEFDFLGNIFYGE